MKKILKKLGIVALVLGILSPYMELPVKAAETNCKYYLNQYLYMDELNAAYLLNSDRADDDLFYNRVNYTSFLYTFPEISSSQTIEVVGAGEVLLDDKEIIEDYYSYYLQIIEDEDEGYSSKAINKFGNYTEQKYNGAYESVTTVIHGYWADDDDDGDSTSASWEAVVENVGDSDNYYDFTLHGFLLDSDIDLDDAIENEFGGATLTALTNSGKYGAPLRNTGYKNDLEKFMSKIVLDVNSGNTESESYENKYVLENSEGELYFNTRITRSLTEDAAEDLNYGYKSVEDGKYYVFSSSSTEIKDSFETTSKLITDNKLDYSKCTAENNCYAKESSKSYLNVDVSRNFYWPAMYAVEYKVCGKTNDDGTPTDQTWTVKYDKNSGTDEVTNMPSPLTETANVGKSILVSNSTPKRNGYSFKNWCTYANGSGDCYEIGKEIKNGGVSNNLTLFAQWVEEGTTENPKQGVVSYIIGFMAVGAIAGGIYLVSKKKNLFKQI